MWVKNTDDNKLRPNHKKNKYESAINGIKWASLASLLSMLCNFLTAWLFGIDLSNFMDPYSTQSGNINKQEIFNLIPDWTFLSILIGITIFIVSISIRKKGTFTWICLECQQKKLAESKLNCDCGNEMTMIDECSWVESAKK